MKYMSILPEILVVSTGLLVIIIDMLISEKRRTLLGYLSLSGLTLALGSCLLFWNSRGIFFNTLGIDGLSVIVRATILVTAILITLVAIKNTSTIQLHQGEFFSLLLFSITGAMILTSAKELITLYLGLELSTIPMYVLVIFRKDKAIAGEAAIKYFLLGLLSSIFLLYGLSLIYGATGSIELVEIGKQIGGHLSPILIVASLLSIVGFGFKITTVPFHFWAPDTYEGAPIIVVAYLATVLKLGAFAAISRFFLLALPATKPHWSLWFGTIAIITMTLGNVMALPQKNIKRMMAYSGIAHVGYPLIGLAVGTKLGISALFFYLITYVISTVGVFFVMYARSSKQDSDDIESFKGLAQTNPTLALVMSMSLFSLIGFPPLVGFFGKLYLILSTIEAHKIYLGVFLLVNSVISFGYYSKVIKAMYLSEPEGTYEKIPVGVPALVSLALSAAGVLFIGILQKPIWHYAQSIFSNVKF